MFRVNDADSRVLGDGFVNFEAKDLRNPEIGSAISRVERSDFAFNLKVPLSESRRHLVETATRAEVIASSTSKICGSAFWGGIASLGFDIEDVEI